MTSATSGPTWRTPFAFYDPESQCLRTSQGTFLSDLTESSLTLPRWGMWADGEFYELPMPALPTTDPESSSLLPTPTVSDTNGAGLHGDGGLDLRTSVSLLPTPRSARGDSGTETMYCLGAERSDANRPQGEVLLPTPSAADGMGGHENRSGQRSSELLLPGLARELAGARMSPLSDAGNESSDEWLLDLQNPADPEPND
jgi:hypothetical protein